MLDVCPLELTDPFLKNEALPPICYLRHSISPAQSMSIYDRPYMRHQETARTPLSIITWIFLITTGAYLFQSITVWWFHSGWMLKYLSLNTDGLLSGRIWTLLTYTLLHDPHSPMHLIMNMLGLFLIGRGLTQTLSERKIVELYLLGGLTGAFFYLLFNHSHSYLMGASASVMGLLTFYCLRNAHQPITFLIFFVLPVTLKPKTLLWILFWVESLMLISEITGNSSVAASAHLGGMMGGVLYFRFLADRSFMGNWRRQPKIRVHIQRPTAVIEAETITEPIDKQSLSPSDRQQLKGEVDRILDKINENGFGSLTESEKKTLDRARTLLSR
jgi:membrane associated rhomboid family serine protease